jgi:hypothetical protein
MGLQESGQPLHNRAGYDLTVFTAIGIDQARLQGGNIGGMSYDAVKLHAADGLIEVALHHRGVTHLVQEAVELSELRRPLGDVYGPGLPGVALGGQQRGNGRARAKVQEFVTRALRQKLKKVVGERVQCREDIVLPDGELGSVWIFPPIGSDIEALEGVKDNGRVTLVGMSRVNAQDSQSLHGFPSRTRNEAAQ